MNMLLRHFLCILHSVFLFGCWFFCVDDDYYARNICHISDCLHCYRICLLAYFYTVVCFYYTCFEWCIKWQFTCLFDRSVISQNLKLKGGSTPSKQLWHYDKWYWDFIDSCRSIDDITKLLSHQLDNKFRVSQADTYSSCYLQCRFRKKGGGGELIDSIIWPYTIHFLNRN